MLDRVPRQCVAFRRPARKPAYESPPLNPALATDFAQHIVRIDCACIPIYITTPDKVATTSHLASQYGDLKNSLAHGLDDYWLPGAVSVLAS